TEEKLLASARFALEIGRRIGKKVIVAGTSTGATLALFLAALHETKQNVEALVLYSPLIDFYGWREKLLKREWFRNLLQLFPGPRYLMRRHQKTKTENEIWYNTYALQG